jgi:hypothetical protein
LKRTGERVSSQPSTEALTLATVKSGPKRTATAPLKRRFAGSVRISPEPFLEFARQYAV